MVVNSIVLRGILAANGFCAIIATSFAEIEMARLLVLQYCSRLDEEGVQDARDMIAASKISVPIMVQNIIDRCMQMHGAGGLTSDYFMAEAFN